MLDDLRTLAPVRSPSSSSCRNPADLHVLKSQQRRDSPSTGQGVGFAGARRIRERGGKVILAKDVSDLKPFVRETWSLLEEAYRKNQNVFFTSRYIPRIMSVLGLFASVLWTALYFASLVFPERHALLQYICFPPMALAEVVTGFCLMLFAVGKESKTPTAPASSAVDA